jgi:regulator of RNase E activity RraB
MNIAELLLETAEADRDLLRSNLDHGDNPDLPRDLEFVLYAATEERARLVCDFVTDNGYGRSRYECLEAEGGSGAWRLLVTINAPTTPEIVCTLSGFMACLSKIYDLEYDGWGCVIRSDA